FMPFGSDKEVSSNFQLIAGTNKDLIQQCQKGEFREDLLARIDLWTYRLPSLNERKEDIEPNLDYELERFSTKSGYLVKFNKTARDKYLSFSHSAEAVWSANFRDLNASITRMGTLADGGRVTIDLVDEEITRLKRKWRVGVQDGVGHAEIIDSVLGAGYAATMDYFEQIQLAALIQVCKESKSMADAGRKLFNVSRAAKKSSNDSHRVKQLLGKYGLEFVNL
ncbi:MAG: sigma 54-interacting transcriptional regulator, partial [Porticoccaceae bacterium]|nr:sigma 54-interacting transcriptional regulator [Porticoccaceae bacterium]